MPPSTMPYKLTTMLEMCSTQVWGHKRSSDLAHKASLVIGGWRSGLEKDIGSLHIPCRMQVGLQARTEAKDMLPDSSATEFVRALHFSSQM